jgi:hypothetical protein
MTDDTIGQRDVDKGAGSHLALPIGMGALPAQTSEVSPHDRAYPRVMYKHKMVKYAYVVQYYRRYAGALLQQLLHTLHAEQSSWAAAAVFVAVPVQLFCCGKDSLAPCKLPSAYTHIGLSLELSARSAASRASPCLPWQVAT